MGVLQVENSAILKCITESERWGKSACYSCLRNAEVEGEAISFGTEGEEQVAAVCCALRIFEGKKKVRLVHKWEVLTWEYLNCEQKDCREEQMDLTRRESRSPLAGTVGSEPPVQ